MKKHTLFTSICAFALLGGAFAPVAFAKTEMDVSSGKSEKAEKADLAAVPAALAAIDKADIVNGAKPDLKAKVYYLLKSRSTCGYCVAEAPKLVEIYKKMKGKGAELILIDMDTDAATAKKWAAKSKMRYPVISPECAGASSIPFPFTGGRTLPFVVAVDAEGHALGQANAADVAAFVGKWKELVQEQKGKKKDK